MIRPVSYADILNDPNVAELLDGYAEECSLPELGKPCPQPELYAMLEKSGGLQVFGVYDDDHLIGFAAVLIYLLPHYGKKVAATESIFVSKRNRYSDVGMDLKEYIEEYARVNGCEAFLYSAPAGSRFDQLLALLYPHTNNVYLRNLA